MPITDPPSILADETKPMERARRAQEQQFLRQHSQLPVRAKERSLDPVVQELGEDYQAGMLQHPLLDGQHLDGVENNPPDPSISPAAREKHLEAQRKQKLDKELKLSLNPDYQNRLTNTRKFNPKPGLS